MFEAIWMDYRSSLPHGHVLSALSICLIPACGMSVVLVFALGVLMHRHPAVMQLVLKLLLVQATVFMSCGS